MERTAINPSSWSMKLGFDQATLVKGHRRELICSAQDAVDTNGKSQHPSDMAAGHSEWMHDGHQTFRRLIALITDFLHRSLGGDTAGRFSHRHAFRVQEEVRRREPVGESPP